jgi:predicted RNase H-like HicB family nuclease
MAVTTYDLYLQSGPMRKRTYIHVPALLGCIAQGETTGAAVEAAPDAIRAYLAFLARSGEAVDPGQAVEVRVVEENLDGGFLGSGFLPTDVEPLLEPETERLMRRLAAIHGEIRGLVAPLSTEERQAAPPKGRPIARILTHLCSEGGYLRGVTGASRIQRLVDQGELDPLDALDQLHGLEVARLAGMSDAERRDVVMRGQSPWSVRSAVRRMLEHGWEHCSEISARLG